MKKADTDRLTALRESVELGNALGNMDAKWLLALRDREYTESYDKGYKDGQQAAPSPSEYNKAYDKGYRDGWLDADGYFCS